MADCEFLKTQVCPETAVALWKITCEHCEGFWIRAFCEHHQRVVQSRIDRDANVNCRGCRSSKSSERSYTYLGKA